MSELILERHEPWTIADLYELPDSASRIEIVDGGLVVTPPPTRGHPFVLTRLNYSLSTQLGAGFVVIENVGVGMGTSYRIPDLSVIRRERFAANGEYFVPADIEIAVEVVSPSTQSQDRILKPAQYAEAGIGSYWRIETDPEISLSAYALRGAAYEEIGTWTAGHVAQLNEPFDLASRSTTSCHEPRPAMTRRRPAHLNTRADEAPYGLADTT